MRLGEMSVALALSTLAHLCPVCRSLQRAAGCDGLKTVKSPTEQSSQRTGGSRRRPHDRRRSVFRKNMPALPGVVASVKDAPIFRRSDRRPAGCRTARVEERLPRQRGKPATRASSPMMHGAMEAAIKRSYASAMTDLGMKPATPLNGDATSSVTRTSGKTGECWGRTRRRSPAARSRKLSCSARTHAPRALPLHRAVQQAVNEDLSRRRCPEDFDGILAGAPVVSRTSRHAVAVTRLPGGEPEAQAQALRRQPRASQQVGHRRPATRATASSPIRSSPDPLACDFDHRAHLQGRRSRRLPAPNRSRPRRRSSPGPGPQRQAAVLR